MPDAGAAHLARVAAAGVDETLAAVREILGALVPAAGGVDAHTPLLDDGLALDSILILELVLALEERFACQIASAELTPANLATVGSLAALVARKRREAVQAGA